MVDRAEGRCEHDEHVGWQVGRHDHALMVQRERESAEVQRGGAGGCWGFSATEERGQGWTWSTLEAVWALSSPLPIRCSLKCSQEQTF